MSLDQFFQTENCNGWLTQVAIAKTVLQDPQNEIPLLQFVGQRVGVAWASWGISFIALVQIFIWAGLQPGMHKWQAGAIMLFWTVAQIPLLVIITKLHTDSLHDQDNNESDFNDLERFQRFLRSWIAIQQFLTMSLIMVIWLAIMYFKKHLTQLIKDSYWRKDLEEKIGLENKVSMAFAAINALYQIILFIVVNVQIESELAIDAIFDNLVPQEFNKNLRNTAIFIGLMNCIFIIGFLALMALQSISFFHIVNHSIQRPQARLALFIMTSLLAIVFINDVFSMMLYYWGAPAFTMTRTSFEQQEGFVDFVNQDTHCLSFLIIGQVLVDQVVSPTSSGQFLRIIFAISEFTPLIWSSVFAIVFFSMQFAYDGAIHHADYSQNRQDLVRKGQGYINNTEYMSSSGQVSLDQSHNQLRY